MNSIDPKLLEELNHCLDVALKEDDVDNDITSLGCLSSTEPVEAKLYLKQKARIAGLAFLPHIFQRFDPQLKVQLNAQDGEEYEEGTILAQIIGNPKAIISIERIAINLISHLSGIAQITSEYVTAKGTYSCDILDTRKTLPGLRLLQKYAVRMGGGKNHRLSLSDKILIKDNHIAVLKHKTNYDLLEAISHARSRFPAAHLEIEVTSIEELDEALASKPDSILLDNMSINDVREAVIRTRDQENIYLEASGGIQINTIKEYAATGVDGISIGALTHSAKAVDMSLKI